MILLNNFYLNKISLGNVTFDDNTIYFLIYVIIGIILLAAPLFKILDTDADYRLRQVYKQGKTTILIYLAYIILPVPANSDMRPLFFYDRLDPTGVKMSSLFTGSGYNVMIHNGSRGYSGVTTRSLNQDNELPVIASTSTIHLLENGGGAILSNGSGIKKSSVTYGTRKHN